MRPRSPALDPTTSDLTAPPPARPLVAASVAGLGVLLGVPGAVVARAGASAAWPEAPLLHPVGDVLVGAVVVALALAAPGAPGRARARALVVALAYAVVLGAALLKLGAAPGAWVVAHPAGVLAAALVLARRAR